MSVFVTLWLSWDLEEWKEEALAIRKDDIFVHTFYGRMTGRAYAKKRFVEGDDLTRMGIVTSVHRALWSEIEEEVGEWLGECWEELHSSKPDWFSEELVRKVPADLIPHMNLASVREEGGEELVEEYERGDRMSIRESLKRVVRESFRESHMTIEG